MAKIPGFKISHFTLHLLEGDEIYDLTLADVSATSDGVSGSTPKTFELRTDIRAFSVKVGRETWDASSIGQDAPDYLPLRSNFEVTGTAYVNPSTGRSYEALYTGAGKYYALYIEDKSDDPPKTTKAVVLVGEVEDEISDDGSRMLSFEMKGAGQHPIFT